MIQFVKDNAETIFICAALFAFGFWLGNLIGNEHGQDFARSTQLSGESRIIEYELPGKTCRAITQFNVRYNETCRDAR